MTPDVVELASPIAPLWNAVIAIALVVIAVVICELVQEKDDVQKLVDQRRDEQRQQMRDV